ncbi:MAG: FAD-binding domain-containing protein [Candidatus Baltobacteraceae bacterium]
MNVREEALQRLESLDLRGYAERSAYLDGNVTHLSAYIRFGILSLVEVRDRAFVANGEAESRERFLSALAKYDYARRVLALLGGEIHRAIEPLKTGWAVDSYERSLPEDILAASTGLACIDGFVSELREMGYLHQRARKWLAAYLVHWRRVAWETGAKFFLEFSIDGDRAVNDLAWQSVASSFSDAPYAFDRAELERYSRGRFCGACPKRFEGCPFEGESERLADTLFPAKSNDSATAPELRAAADARTPAAQLPARPILLHHYGAMRPVHPAARLVPDAPAVFVNDAALYDEAGVNQVGRTIVYAALGSMRSEYRVGDFVDETLAFARAHETDGIVVTESAEPSLRRRIRRLGDALPVTVVPEDPFVFLDDGADLRRFLRYWALARRSLNAVSSAANSVPLFSN